MGDINQYHTLVSDLTLELLVDDIPTFEKKRS